MQKLTRCLLASFPLFFLHPAHAMNSGMYLGAQAGYSNLNNKTQYISSGPTTVTATPSNTGFGGRISAGFLYNSYLGMEGGYTYYSPTKYSTSQPISCNQPTISTQAVDLVGKGIFAMEAFGLFAKAGVAAAYVNESGSLQDDSSSDGCGGSSGNIKIRPTATLGVSYDLTQNWQTDLSWSRIFAAGGSSMQNADLVSIGVSYHFVDKYCGQFLC